MQPATVTKPPVRVLWLIKGLGAGGAERLVVHSAQRRDRTVVDPHVAYLLRHKSALLPELEQADVTATLPGCASVLGPAVDPRAAPAVPRRELRRRPLPLADHDDRSPDRAAQPSPPRPAAAGHDRAQRLGQPRRATRVAPTPRRRVATRSISRCRRRCGTRCPTGCGPTTRVIQYGVDVEAVRAAAPGREAGRRALAVGPDEVLVGTVANLRATKGYPDLLVAAAQGARQRFARQRRCALRRARAGADGTGVARAGGTARSRRPVPLPRLPTRRRRRDGGVRHLLSPVAARGSADRVDGGAGARYPRRRDRRRRHRRDRDRRSRSGPGAPGRSRTPGRGADRARGRSGAAPPDRRGRPRPEATISMSAGRYARSRPCTERCGGR